MMKLSEDIISKIKEHIRTGLVRMSQSEKYPELFVIKYTRKVFYDGLWDDTLEYCRGLVVDAEWNVVVRPFKKIYNYGIEAKAPVIDDGEMVDAYRKVNGFMVAVTSYNGTVIVSTTGSLDSPYVAMAKEYVTRELEIVVRWYQHMTFMFECVHPDDPHIISEKPGLYFLGAVDKKTSFVYVDEYESDMLKYTDVWLIESYQISMGYLKTLARAVTHEGFVFYLERNGVQISAKIKTPYYLFNKFVARNPRTDKLMKESAYEIVDEEYYPLLDKIRENIVEYTKLDEQQRIQWVRDYYELSKS